MKTLVFDTLEQAQAAIAALDSAAPFPEGAVTRSWSVAEELADGRWAVTVPDRGRKAKRASDADQKALDALAALAAERGATLLEHDAIERKRARAEREEAKR